MDILGLFSVGKMLVDTIVEQKNTNELRKSDDFKEEVNQYVDELSKKDNLTLLFEFHEEYGQQYYSDCLIVNTDFLSDARYEAYKQLFTKRHFEKMEAECPCGKRLGYRMSCTDQDNRRVITGKSGEWSCSCGKRGYWNEEDDFIKIEET